MGHTSSTQRGPGNTLGGYTQGFFSYHASLAKLMLQDIVTSYTSDYGSEYKNAIDATENVAAILRESPTEIHLTVKNGEIAELTCLLEVDDTTHSVTINKDQSLEEQVSAIRNNILQPLIKQIISIDKTKLHGTIANYLKSKQQSKKEQSTFAEALSNSNILQGKDQPMIVTLHCDPAKKEADTGTALFDMVRISEKQTSKLYINGHDFLEIARAIGHAYDPNKDKKRNSLSIDKETAKNLLEAGMEGGLDLVIATAEDKGIVDIVNYLRNDGAKPYMISRNNNIKWSVGLGVGGLAAGGALAATLALVAPAAAVLGPFGIAAIAVAVALAFIIPAAIKGDQSSKKHALAQATKNRMIPSVLHPDDDNDAGVDAAGKIHQTDSDPITGLDRGQGQGMSSTENPAEPNDSGASDIDSDFTSDSEDAPDTPVRTDSDGTQHGMI